MPEQMPQPYEGDRPYIVVSYARADEDASRSIIRALVDVGYRVWWGGGIRGGTEFSDYIADRIHDCACVIMLISSASVASDWCRDEVRFARDLNKGILPIYLQDVELPRFMQFRLGGLQPLFWFKYETDERFNEDLFAVQMLDLCLAEEGKIDRGVKARDAVMLGDNSVPQVDATVDNEEQMDAGDPTSSRQKTEEVNDGQTSTPRTRLSLTCSVQVAMIFLFAILISLELGLVIRSTSEQEADIHAIDSAVDGFDLGIPIHEELNEYSWHELKVLSQAIAGVRNNEHWLDIAKLYNLVDKEGKLFGDVKFTTLDDGTWTAVRILGFRHDVLVDGGRAGITFEFVDVPETHWMNEDDTNDGGWKKSDMREWLNSEFLNRLPWNLRLCIETVKKQTNNVGKVEPKDDVSVVAATDDKLWLLSAPEVYGSAGGLWSSAGDDTGEDQYQLYADKGVTTETFNFCGKSGAYSIWWLRTPCTISSSGFRSVANDGDWTWNYANSELGVSPGFCL